MQFIKPDINIDFIGKRVIAYGISGVLILISIITLILHGGPKYGIDFAGGTVIQVKFDAAVKTDAIRKGLADVGVRQPTLQIFGEAEDNEYLIRSDASEEDRKSVG